MQAFPGAYGWGAEAIGGRGGVIKEVTNLNASGAGSLTAAMGGSGARIVIPRVTGVITLKEPIYIFNPYVTFAGQAGPGSGLVIRGYGIEVWTHDVIIQYLTYRGTGGPSDFAMFTFRTFSGDVYNVIADHCSGSWSMDDLIDAWNNSGSGEIYNVTIQNGLYGQPSASHPTAGVMVGRKPDLDYPIHHFTIYKNLFSSSGHRNPNLTRCSHVEVINNTVYNYGHRVGDLVTDDLDAPEADYINNYFHRGPMSADIFVRWEGGVASPDNPVGSIYARGNIAPVAGGLFAEPMLDPGADNWPFFTYKETGLQLDPMHKRITQLSPSPNPCPEMLAVDARTQILAGAGNSRRLDSDGNWVSRRDSLDAQLVNEAENDTGSSSFPVIPGTLPAVDVGTPYTDTDDDGTPDDWEVSQGLNPNDPADGPLIGPDGYSNVELFLNGPEEEAPVMSIVTDLQAIETALRQEVLNLTAQADAIAQAILDLQVIDDTFDAAADAIEVD